MKFLTALTALAAFQPAFGSATPNEKRTDPGFPNPNQQQLSKIEFEASGRLPGGSPPTNLAKSTITALQLIAFNELFEVAFFSSLLKNVTSGVDGYEIDRESDAVNILTTVVAQEELHALGAIGLLKANKAFAPSPCKYKFPTTNLDDAVGLAITFTDVVLGTLQDASDLFASNGEPPLVRQVASIIGQEGEQNGFYRGFLERIPSSKPFLTTSVAAYAFSALQGFVDSCPFDVSKINLPIFPALNVVSGKGGTDVKAEDQQLEFSAKLKKEDARKYRKRGGKGLYVTYLNGQLPPFSEPIKHVRFRGETITFRANFPFEENILTGLTIAGLTTKGEFGSPDELPDATLAAPGLIQVNVKFTD